MVYGVKKSKGSRELKREEKNMTAAKERGHKLLPIRNRNETTEKNETGLDTKPHPTDIGQENRGFKDTSFRLTKRLLMIFYRDSSQV